MRINMKFACMLLLCNNLQSLDIARYLCCFEIQKQREYSTDTVEGFCDVMQNGTWTNRDSQDEQNVSWYKKITKSWGAKNSTDKSTNQIHTILLTHDNLQQHQAQQILQSKDNNAQADYHRHNSFVKPNPLDTSNGKSRKWWGKNKSE